MSQTFRRRLVISLVTLPVVLSLGGCGTNAVYEAGLSRFQNEVPTQWNTNNRSNWQVYVAPGPLSTGWLWFRKQSRVIYTEVEYFGVPNADDVVIKFGNKTIKDPAMPGGGGISFTDFYVTSNPPPQIMDISWKANGKSLHQTIHFSSITVLPEVSTSS